ncbi:MAG: glycoside hydrolase family 15 protein [Actinomycetota bacterium]|nr:glycoside hydrolase family 15 protein [Actinomycetota bacterium]
MPLRIEDYGLIGDTQTAALVGRDGSIDWLCLPRFDSGACFAALLGDERHGRWRLAPAGRVHRVTRRYRPGTLVLETDVETDEGVVRVTDCMPPRGEAPDLVRLVRGLRGRVPMTMELVLRFDYGHVIPWVRQQAGVLTAVAGPDAVLLATPAPLRGEGLTTRADFTVGEGEEVPFVLTWHPSERSAPRPVDARVAVEDTARWWEAWSSRCAVPGPWGELVQRSLITLKAMTYAPTGGIVAAVTTSLPEQLGGPRNWDYRFCWIRDATLTLLALLDVGYTDEAAAWRDWLLRSCAGWPSDMQIMYGPSGERRLTEVELEWLPGYEGSRPVRIGNAASRQFQLDVYGELMDAMLQAREAGLEPDEHAWGLQRALLQFLEEGWREPDEGIWEVRGERRHFVHSKVMAWVAFDRAVITVERFGMEGPLERWRALRDEIHAEVCERGFDVRRGTFTQAYGSRALDAALLLLPAYGFLPSDDERIVGTVEAVQRELSRDGLVLRYETQEAADGLPPGEGAFLPCSFWLVDALVLIGRREEAEALFARLVGLVNDLGLLSEEYDVGARRLVGNFPQAFSHIGLVNSALALTRATAAAPALERAERARA